MDSAEPTNGWSVKDILSKPPAARNDVYGSLYFHILEQLQTFCKHITSLQIRFSMYAINAVDLPGLLTERGTGEKYFDRIEVSNIGDRSYLGPEKLPATFAPCLKRKSQNPHATLLALFLNSVHECSTANDNIGNFQSEAQQLSKYMSLPPEVVLHGQTWNADLIRYNDARSMFRDFDKPFARFEKECCLNETTQIVELKMKNKHTLVEKWPLKLKKGATQEEFDMSLASGSSTFTIKRNQDINNSRTPTIRREHQISKMLPCKYFPTPAGCGRDNKCQYQHDAEAKTNALPSIVSLTLNDEIQPLSQRLSPLSHAKIACRFFAKGFCGKGDACLFSHGVEKVALATPALDGICSFFARGKCARGNNCRFQHFLTESNSYSTLKSGAQVTSIPEQILPTTIDTHSATLNVTPAVTKNYDDTPDGMLTRELSGGLTTFGDGGKVYKVSVPSDFTTIRITGLPQGTDLEFMETILSTVSLKVPRNYIRITSKGTPPSISAFLRIEGSGSMVSSVLCQELETGWSGSEKYGKLEAASATTNLFSASETSRQVDRCKIVCSWYRSTKLAVLKYENKHTAQIVCNNFNNGCYRVMRKVFECDQPLVSKNWHDREHKFLCILKNLPVLAEREDIEGAMEKKYRPDELVIGKKNYEASDDLTRDHVRSLFSAIGPLESWDPSQDPVAKRVKVRVRFQNESDTQEAIAQLHNKNIEILGKGKLMIQQLISARFKVTTKIYRIVASQLEAEKKVWVEQRIYVGAYQSTDVAQRFTSLKIEGEPGENFVNAKDKLEKMLSGVIALADGKPVWNDYFLQPIGWSKLKQIEKDCDVVIGRDRKRQQLLLYGSSGDTERAQYTLDNMVEAGLEGYAIKLSLNQFWWLKNGGFEQIVLALGEDVASIDVLSYPKKLLLAGGPENYYKAMAILRSKIKATRIIVKEKVNEDEEDCCICWCPAEAPIRTHCGHLYCLQCFETLCSSTATGDKEVIITCMMDGCDVVLSLQEIQQHLPSVTFEELLEASFTSYIRRHPQDFHYCPTPDCEQIYRVTLPIKSRTCAKCLAETCISCHVSHAGQTCVEYRYQKEGGDAAFENAKSELGFKDCPKCKTTIEKSSGCNHMICSACKIHICWVCLDTFERESRCYDHLSAKHGGFGLRVP
ncbi:hypothetical protein SBOR_10093 [Sclerotinia borealis F-4128]|uniref:RBR-type E3 ubiquitin transferase n=1 Tax=Sclerotinia borealis (strain F-4128) TaxID=1432307 RepID=W9C1D2_SCLBF|nr:hypothetical protein SBOR_10093 [Sclerotinia borealis F-4128]